MVRLGFATALGVLTAVLVGLQGSDWHYAPAVGWIVGAVVYLAATWWTVLPMDSEQTADHVWVRQDGTPGISHMIVLVASVASLAGVGYLLAAESGGGHDVVEALIGILSVVAAWFAVHTTFTLRYATLFYTDEQPGPINYHQQQYRPCYKDFAYLAFTVGMTYQVSDTDLSSPRIRGSVLTQAMVSFMLGVVVLASTINLILALAS